MNIIEQLETEQLGKLTESKQHPEFAPGDTVRIQVKVIEGERERLQAFEGVCIARKNAGLNSSFTVRKIASRSEAHTSELQSHPDPVCRLLLEKKKN